MNQSPPASTQTNKVWGNIIKIVESAERILVIFAVISLAAMFVSIIAGIVWREFLNKPILWTTDLSSYLLVYVVFLSAPWILKHGGHVQIDIITSKLKGKTLHLNVLIVSFLLSIIFIIFFYFSLETTLTLYEKGTVKLENVPWPKYLLVAPIPVGSFFIFTRLVLNVIQSFRQLKQKPGLNGQNNETV